jgi:hypothetical protein
MAQQVYFLDFWNPVHPDQTSRRRPRTISASSSRARIRRACGGMRNQNCLAIAFDLDGRQRGKPLAVILVR